MALDKHSTSRLWALTCFFNPLRYQSRIRNFKIFKEHLPIPLLAVEQAFDSHFVLDDRDADLLVRVPGGDVMWQKERLLNIGLKSLPSCCDRVVWIDADVVFMDPKWPDIVSTALDRWPVLQAYSIVHQVQYEDGTWKPKFTNKSTMAALNGNSRAFADILRNTLDRGTGPSSGYVWAARRDPLSRHGFYDACIVGGGDTAFLCALTGEFEQVVQLHHMGLAQTRCYLEWARPVFRDFHQMVGVLDLEIQHLWHGSPEDRQTAARHVGLGRLGFDPRRDIALDCTGAWCWASDHPQLQHYVHRYFAGRLEDKMETVF